MTDVAYNIPDYIPHSIFRTYDIRGIVDEALTEEVVYAIALAIGSENQAQGQKQIIMARDGRLSGPKLAKALRAGLLDSGCDVIDIGLVPTPVLYFATQTLSTNSGVMLTGSHNPTNYNGLKIVIAGKTLSEETVQALYKRIINNNLSKGKGNYEEIQVTEEYINYIAKDINLKRHLKIVVDCGNGIPAVTAPKLFKKLGCEVIELYCEVDGNFPNHHPDPSVPENLQDIIATVKKHNADIGLAFDGDGDRIGVVTNTGEIIWPDRQMMLLVIDVLSRNPGAPIVFDVKCSKHLPDVIKQYGGNPIMWKTGHSLIKAKMKEVKSPFSGELSGHLFYSERWFGFDDGVYAAARLLEIIAAGNRSSDEIFKSLPNSVNTPELKVPMSDDKKSTFMQQLVAKANFPDADINTIDGLRVDFNDGFGLVRPSNTTPYLTVRFEAKDSPGLQRIQDNFRQQLLAVDAELLLPF